MNAPPKITSMTSREFNQDTARAKRAALVGPVYITSRGEPTHVLISKLEFDRLEAEKGPAMLTGRPRSIVEALQDLRPEADFDFNFPEFKEIWPLPDLNLDDTT